MLWLVPAGGMKLEVYPHCRQPQYFSLSPRCSGTSVRSTRGVAASSPTRCRGSIIFVYVAAATSASCRGTSQQNIAFWMFLQLLTLSHVLSRQACLYLFHLLISFFYALGLLTTCTSEVCLCTLWLASFSTTCCSNVTFTRPSLMPSTHGDGDKPLAYCSSACSSFFHRSALQIKSSTFQSLRFNPYDCDEEYELMLPVSIEELNCTSQGLWNEGPRSP